MVFRLWFSHEILDIQHVKQIDLLKFQGHQEAACSQLPSSPRDPQSPVSNDCIGESSESRILASSLSSAIHLK